jgi:hypothetical protein
MVLLRESGMTQPAIAAAMGVSLSTVNRAQMAYVCRPEVSWTGSYLNRLGSFVQALQTGSNGVSPFKVLRRLAKL